MWADSYTQSVSIFVKAICVETRNF